MNIHERIARFRKDDRRRSELQAIIESPTFREARSLLLELFFPDTIPNTTGAEETKTNLALRFAHRSGMNACFQTLDLLTTEAKEIAPLDVEPWSEYGKPPEKKATRKK